MKVLQKVEIDGLFFVQAHIDEPPKKSFLRDMADDVKSMAAWVRNAGHNRAFIAIKKENPRMCKFVTARGFQWCADFHHLKIFVCHV